MDVVRRRGFLLCRCRHKCPLAQQFTTISAVASSGRWPDSRDLHRITNNCSAFLSPKMRLATPCSLKRFFREPFTLRQQRPRSMKKIRFPLMIAVALIGAFTLYSEQKHPSLARQGKSIFRFDTFGDQDFWGGTLQLHKAIEGAQHGGVGPGVSPATALAVDSKWIRTRYPRRWSSKSKLETLTLMIRL